MNTLFSSYVSNKSYLKKTAITVLKKVRVKILAGIEFLKPYIKYIFEKLNETIKYLLIDHWPLFLAYCVQPDGNIERNYASECSFMLALGWYIRWFLTWYRNFTAEKLRHNKEESQGH